MSELKIESNIPLQKPNNTSHKKKYVEIFEKMKFGDSVFIKEKKDYISFASSLRDYVGKNHHLYPNTLYFKKQYHEDRGLKESQTIVQYVYGRNIGNGYRVWLLDGKEMLIEKDNKNPYWKNTEYYTK
tara:strand:- start:204 stop:587 length:384 start_codon:yes stop_codon:yes gene_type:complete